MSLFTTIKVREVFIHKKQALTIDIFRAVILEKRDFRNYITIYYITLHIICSVISSTILLQKSWIKMVLNKINNITLIGMFTPDIFLNTWLMSFMFPCAGSLVRKISFGELHNRSRRHSSACVKSCESSTYIWCIFHEISFSFLNLKVFHFYFLMRNMRLKNLIAHLRNISNHKYTWEKINNYVWSYTSTFFKLIRH